MRGYYSAVGLVSSGFAGTEGPFAKDAQGKRTERNYAACAFGVWYPVGTRGVLRTGFYVRCPTYVALLTHGLQCLRPPDPT